MSINWPLQGSSFDVFSHAPFNGLLTFFPTPAGAATAAQVRSTRAPLCEPPCSTHRLYCLLIRVRAKQHVGQLRQVWLIEVVRRILRLAEGG